MVAPRQQVHSHPGARTFPPSRNINVAATPSLVAPHYDGAGSYREVSRAPFVEHALTHPLPLPQAAACGSSDALPFSSQSGLNLHESDDPAQEIEKLQLKIHSTMEGLLKNSAVKSSLNDFLSGVVQGEVVPALCQHEAQIDVGRYWEKRHVQNKLRRLVESLQEYLGGNGGTMPSRELGALAWQTLRDYAPQASTMKDTRRRTGSRSSASLPQRPFVQALHDLGVWPEDLNDADRCEVFIALLASSGAVVRAYTAGLSLNDELTERMFCEGLSRVPFNVPDYPVPTSDVTDCIWPSSAAKSHEQKVFDVAEVIASIFAQDSALLDAKDFFLCGLLSLEEIQAALPRLVKLSIVDQAVKHIIREGMQHFRPGEWRKLICPVRFPQADDASLTTQQPTARPEEPAVMEEPLVPEEGPMIAEDRIADAAGDLLLQSPSLQSPVPTYRTLDEPSFLDASPVVAATDAGSLRQQTPVISTPPTWRAPPAEEPSVVLPREESNSTPPSQASGVPPHRGAHTEPVVAREIRSEEPVTNFLLQDTTVNSAASGGCLINWSTSMGTANIDGHSREEGGDTSIIGHQADEGAGTQRSIAESASDEAAQPQPAVVNTSAFGPQSRGLDRNDLLCYVSLEMHSECSGPFLARAFVRCCALYEAVLHE